MTPIEFTIPGRPVSWKRPASRGKQRFTDPKQRVLKHTIQAIAANATDGRPCGAWLGPVRLEIACFFPCGRVHAPGEPHLFVPDPDNLAKLIQDALNGIAYGDDAQICDLVVTKRYGEPPRTEVTVAPLFAHEVTGWGGAG